MLDNFTPFDSLTLQASLSPQEFSAESSPSVSYSTPTSYVLRGKSTYAVGASGYNPLTWSKKCNTALATEISVIGEENQKLTRIDTTEMADGTKIDTLIIPKGTRLKIQGIPLDTGAKDGSLGFGWTSVTKWAKDGFSQDYKIADESKESNSGDGGVDVYRHYYNYPNLALLAVAESKRQHPEWYNNDDVSVGTFLSNLDKIYSDVGTQMISIAENNYTSLQTNQSKATILTRDGSDNTVKDNNLTTFNKEGSYLLTLRYGYDSTSEREDNWYSYNAGFGNYLVRGILEVGSLVAGSWLAKGLIAGALGLR